MANTSTPEQPFGSVVRERLPNGLRVVLVPLPHLHFAHVSLFFRAGSRHETRASNGIHHLLEHLVFRGTQSLPSTYALNHAIESLGGTLEGASQPDLTQYDLQIVPKNMGDSLRLLADMMQHPVLEGIGSEQRIIKEELLEDLNEDGAQIDVDNVLAHLHFGEHPLGHPIAGTVANVESFTQQDARRQHELAYVANNAVLVLAGNFEEPEAMKVVLDSFASMKSGEQFTESAPKFRSSTETVFVTESASQTEVRLAFATPGAQHPANPSLQLIERILDDGLSTRVHQVICDERSLAYDAFCGLQTYTDCGTFEFGAAVEHAKSPELVETFLQMLDRLKTEAVADHELQKAKARFVWDIELSVDDPGAAADFFGTTALFGWRDDIGAIVHDVRSVTADDIKQAAIEYFDTQKASLATVGMLTPAQQTKVDALIKSGR